MWYITKDNGDPFEIVARTFKQNILINYKLKRISSGNFVSIDRGANTDRYSTTLKFSGSLEYINSLIVVLTDLRTAKKEVVMGGIPDNVGIFGDHISYGGEQRMVVSKFGKLKSPQHNYYTFSVEFLATNLSYYGTPVVPSSMHCLQSDFSTETMWNTVVNETYNRDNYFIDKVTDLYTFKGKYNLSVADNRDLYAWWESRRGSVTQVTESAFGVTNMFGPLFEGTTTFNVIIKNITYDVISPLRRITKIELIKVE